MNCWGIRIYFNKSKFSLNGGYINLTFCSPCIMVIHKWISQPTTALIKFYLHFVSPVLFRMLCQWHAGAILPRRAGIADVTAIIATSRKQALLVSYLEANLTQIERWLREWRIAINVSKSNAALREGWVASLQASTGAAPRGPNPMGRYSLLPGSDPWYTDDLVASYRPCQEESCPKTGSA